MPASEPTPWMDHTLPPHVLRVQQLFVAHQSHLLAFILALHPMPAEAEDVLQETFLVVTARAHTFADGTNFLAWACTIARFKVLEARRRGGREAARLSDAAVESLAADGPGESFFEPRLAALRECLGKLAPRAREVVWLRYQGFREPEEIAREIGWTPGAVRVALTRARAALRDCVEARLKEAAP